MKQNYSRAKQKKSVDEENNPQTNKAHTFANIKQS